MTTSRLSSSTLQQLTPLLGSLARMAATGSRLGDHELNLLLLGADLDAEPMVLGELQRWGRILMAFKEQPSVEFRRATVEALSLRGLPEAPVLLAVDTVANSSPAPVAASGMLKVTPERLDFGLLPSGKGVSAELEVEGGPGQIMAESDQVRVSPTRFGDGTTRVRVEVPPLTGGLLWTSVKLVTADETVEVPLLAQWEEVWVRDDTVPTTIEVPDLTRQKLSQARNILADAGLKLGSQKEVLSDAVAEGEIIGQTPEAGMQMEADSMVSVTVSSGPSTVEVPDLAGLNRSQAPSTLEAAGLKLGDRNEAASDTVTKGGIVKQEPVAGRKAERGSTVSVTVSSGPYKRTSRTFDVEDTLRSIENSRAAEEAISKAGRFRLLRTIEREEHKNWRGKLLLRKEGHTGPVKSVAFSPDGRLLASASEDKTVRLWRVEDGALLRTLEHTDPVTSVALSPDGRLLASGAASDETVRLWRVEDGALLRKLKRSDWRAQVHSVAFSPDGRLLASIANYYHHERVLRATKGTNANAQITYMGGRGPVRVVQLWRVEDGALLRTLEHRRYWVKSVAFSPDGRHLASGGDDNMVRLWQVEDGTLLRTFKGHTNSVLSVAFSPDGRHLASGASDNVMRQWQVVGGDFLTTWEMHTISLRSMAFSPDGWLLASEASDNTVQLYGMMHGELLRTLEGHTDSVLSMAFSPDGRLLASGSKDKTVRLWGIA